MKNAVTFLVGLLFALGLGLSGMTQPQIVRGFLDVTGDWNPALAGVMIGAIGVHGISFFLIRRRSRPFLAEKFHLPQRKDIDPRLIAGAALFGLGWGWAGVCPGPGIVALMGGRSEMLVFVGAMLVGMFIFKLTEKKSTP